MAAPAAQQLRAIHLYRHALRTISSWGVHRRVFYSELARLRDQFESHRHEGDAAAVEGLLNRGEATLREYAHPDPYTVPYAYGGSKYARNPPVPGEIHVVGNYGRDPGTF